MRFIFAMSCAFLLAACSGSSDEATSDAGVSDMAGMDTTALNVSVPMDGKVTLTSETLASEEAACIIPLRVSNGTEETVSVSMFGFAVTGAGDEDTGNMFGQPVPPGEYRTARIIQIGQSCAAFDTITPGDVLCKSGETGECSVEFENSEEISFVTAG